MRITSWRWIDDTGSYQHPVDPKRVAEARPPARAHTHGVKDTNCQGKYHNRRFLQPATQARP